MHRLVVSRPVHAGPASVAGWVMRCARSAASTSRRPTRRCSTSASQVVLARDGDRTVLTMASDFKGAPKEFAVVIPVPTFITREQIHVAEKALIDHLDAYTAPRLVEYFDSDPCRRYEMMRPMAAAGADGRRHGGQGRTREGARRHHRGAVHRRRVRHSDPLGEAERRARDVAHGERLPHSRRRRARDRQLPPAEHAVLRGAE